MQGNGVNYLVPVDAQLTREADVFLSLVSLEQVLQVMETEVPTRLVFLDACRDNPLACSLSRSPGATGSTAVGQGLARMDKAVDTTLLERLQAAAAAVSQQPAEEATVAALPVRPPAEPRSAVPAPGSVIEDCAHCPEQVVVPAGRFRMGSAPG